MNKMGAVLSVMGISLFGGLVLAADEQSSGQPGAGKVVVQQNNPAPQPPQHNRQPPFVPIVDGQLLSYYRQNPSLYSDQLLSAYGYWPPFGQYLPSPRYGYNPDLFGSGGSPLGQSRRMLIVVEPTDAPGTTYYYDSFPTYYGQPGYFPGNSYGDQYVTIVSPTVPQQQAPQAAAQGTAAQPAAAQPAQVRVPAEVAKAAFVSTLSPMLGGDSRVSVDFAVGELRLRQGDYAGAADAFGRAVGAAPDDPTPKLALGLAMMGTGDYEGAAQILKRALRGMPDWRNLTLRPAAVFAGDAAYQAVLGSLQKAPASDKNAQFLLGVLSLATGKCVDAINHFAVAGLDDPLVLGLTMEAQRRDDAAKKAAAAQPAAANQPGK